MFNPREQATRRGFLRGVGLTVFAASAAACARPDQDLQAKVDAAVRATTTAQNTPKPTETTISKPELNLGSDWVTHYSTSLNYSLKRPANWMVGGDSFWSPERSGDLYDSPLSSVDIFNTPIAQSLPLDAVWLQIAEPGIKKKRGVLVSKKNVTIGGQEGLRIAYDSPNIRRIDSNEVVYAVHGNTLWQISFLSQYPKEAKAKGMNEIYDKMIASFQFTSK